MAELEETVAKLTAGVIADKILETMAGPHRDAIMSRAIADALSGYAIKNAVSELIQDRAKEIAKKLIKDGNYDAVIKAELEKAFAGFVAGIQVGATKALNLAFFGYKGKDYNDRDSAGLILKFTEPKT